MTLSIAEDELATSAWFAVNVPGYLAPPIGTTPEPSGNPMNNVLLTCVNANSPFDNPVTTALETDLLIRIIFAI
jgi:hypothetical protein